MRLKGSSPSIFPTFYPIRYWFYWKLLLLCKPFLAIKTFFFQYNVVIDGMTLLLDKKPLSSSIIYSRELSKLYWFEL